MRPLRSIASFAVLAVPFAFAFAAAAPMLAGCQSASCEKICATQNTCSGATQVSDCAAACAADLKNAQMKGCESEYNSHISCLGSINSCVAGTFCTAQDVAYAQCLAKSMGTTSSSGTTGGSGGSGGTTGSTTGTATQADTSGGW